MTPRQMIDWACSRLEESNLYYGHGTDNAYDEAVFIVLQKLQLPFDADNPALDKTLSIEQENAIRAMVEERIHSRKPAAYILGEAWFAGMPFYIDENVLVPRSPFAELILERFSPWCPEQVRYILDIGTGCGCIAIACAAVFPEAQVDAVDISQAALAVARKNVLRHEMLEQIELLKSDLFQKLHGRRYDIIVANPPYVSLDEMKTLPEEYLHEPAVGLEAGREGLDVVERILEQGAKYLTEKGILVVEVGNSQYALTEKYPDVPFLWLEFEHGGEGVFLLTRNELVQYFKEQSSDNEVLPVKEKLPHEE